MAVPYTFGSILGGASIPLSELDDNFSYLTTSPTFTGNVTVNGILDVIGQIRSSDAVLSNNGTVNLQMVSFGVGGFFGTTTNHPLIFQTNNTERARIDGSGNLGVGTTSPVARLDVYNGSGASTSTVRAASGQNAFLSVIGNGNSFLSTSFDIIQDSTNTASIFQRANAPLLFGTNNTERARIDSSGNLLVGTTDNSQTSGPGVKIKNSGGTSGVVSCVATQTNSSADTYHVYSTGAGAYRFYVELSGTIRATSTSIVAISDISLKENIRDLETGLDEILRLKPRRFDWREETKLGVKDVAGFIAQEVEPVLPDLVSDGKYTDEKNKKFVKMGDMIPTMVKAIQELAAKVTELEEKLNAK